MSETCAGFTQLFKTLHFTSPLIINFRDNATYSYVFQHGSGPIHICNVQCNGTETDLTECGHFYHGYYSSYCFHYYDIYIKCDSGKATNLTFIKLYIIQYIQQNIFKPKQ